MSYPVPHLYPPQQESEKPKKMSQESAIQTTVLSLPGLPPSVTSKKALALAAWLWYNQGLIKPSGGLPALSCWSFSREMMAAKVGAAAL